jgi:hypothetical protein
VASTVGAWRCWVIAGAQLMVVLDATIVNVALPHIQRAIGFSRNGLEWVITAYALSFGWLPAIHIPCADLAGTQPQATPGHRAWRDFRGSSRHPETGMSLPAGAAARPRAHPEETQ